MNKISPSVMCIPPLELKSQLKALERAGADQFHIDVMDGHFVSNFSLNQSIVAAVKQATGLPVDVHLMIEDPDRYIPEFAAAGADILIPHLEALRQPIRTLKLIRSQGRKAGIALNPATDINALPYLLDYLDVILVMTVEPGFAGQTLIPGVFGKLARLRGLLAEHGKAPDIMVDGQIMETTAPRLVAAGANVLVLGSSGLFNHPPAEFPDVIAAFRTLGAAAGAAGGGKGGGA
jgi:ribulose-phosphate 3-epimerase